jgi:hypothetical protein
VLTVATPMIQTLTLAKDRELIAESKRSTLFLEWKSPKQTHPLSY